MSISDELDNLANGNPDKKGFINLVKECPTCSGEGEGKILKISCPSCNGTGKIDTEVSMSVMELFLRRQVDKFRRQGLIPPKEEGEE